MAECDDFTLPLDSLFFVKPVVHKVFYKWVEDKTSPLFQEQNVWQLDAAPSISEIPATQAIQKEAESMSSAGCSQKIRKFLPPFQRPFVSAGIQNQRQTDETEGLAKFSVQMSQTPSARKHMVDSRNKAFPDTQDFHNSVKNRPCDPATTQQFKSCLFKPPMKMVSKTLSISSPTSCSVDDHSHSRVSMVTKHPPTAHTIATCSPFLEPDQIEECNAPQQKLDTGVKKAHVLPLTPKPIHIQGPSGPETLRPVTEIPAKFRNVFKEFPYFNYVQSKAIDDVLYTNKNFVACAPTGSGKTVLFELAIIRLLMETAEPWHNVKAVYMAPIKALCSQQYENWKLKFGPLGLNCKELTGDTEIEDVFEIQDAHLIMTTPEKWDSMTRKWKNNCLLQLVQLFLIDEVHVVKDSTRGPTLEVVISRMKTAHAYSVSDPDAPAHMRFVAVSATVPNICDIADWLSDDQGPATCLEMDESHRPVKLRKVVLGFPCGNNQNEFKFDLSLNYKMASVIQTYSDQKPTLVFCSTRKGVQQSATVLAKDARFMMSNDHRQRLKNYSSSLLDAKLKDLVMCGVGYHHAGVSLSDRKVVEDAFTAGDLPVLFTTSTLAMGVNLPAHLVVIKSTMHYAAGSCEEYSESDMLQMIGRAGRPQFDTSATAVIMTRIQTREKYLQFFSGSETIESSLHTNLVEHLNAEIVLHTISDVNMALDWIRSTFLYIRALKNPTHYGFSNDLDKCGIETKLQELCLKNLNSLASYQLITMDEDVNIKPTESGKLMARYYVAFDTMKQFSNLTGTETLWELITVVSKGKEFSDVQLRVNEKRTLNTLNADKNRVTIRYPMEGKIKSNDMKVNCLIQAQLGSLPIQEFGLTQDTGKIFRNGVRVSKCLAEFLSHHSKKNFSAQLNSLILAKCFRAKLWEDSPYVSKQLDKIGLSLATAMVNAGLTSFSKIEATNPRELELIVNRHPPFGNQIKEAVSKLPKYEICLEQLPKYSVSTAEILVAVNLKNFEELLTKRTAPDHHYVNLIIGNSDNTVILWQKIQDTVLLKSGSWSRKIEVTRTSQEDKISINLISSEYVGLDIQQTFSAFYYGAKTFRAESCGKESPQYKLQKIPETSQRATSSALKSHMAPPRAQITAQRGRIKHLPDNKAPAQTVTAKRECNHFCKNKEFCGHDCCKVGVQLVMKRPQNPEKCFSSYLKDLKMRNEKLLETPVKRLKMRMNAEAGNMSVQQFSYTPRGTMPAHTRFSNVPDCTLEAANLFEEKQDCSPSVSHSMEPQWGFPISAETSFNEHIEYPEDFYSETEDTAEEQMFQTDANNSVQNTAYTSRTASERQVSRTPAGRSRDHTTSSHLDHSTDSSSASDALNVTFDLVLDEWDDFDDDNLVLASDVSYSAEKQGSQCVQPTAGTQGCWTSVPTGCSGAGAGLLRSNPTTRVAPTTTAQETQRKSPVISAIKYSSSNLNNTESLPRGRLEFFFKTDPEQDTQKGFNRDQREENKEAEMFVSIFDGIF